MRRQVEEPAVPALTPNYSHIRIFSPGHPSHTPCGKRNFPDRGKAKQSGKRTRHHEWLRGRAVLRHNLEEQRFVTTWKSGASSRRGRAALCHNVEERRFSAALGRLHSWALAPVEPGPALSPRMLMNTDNPLADQINELAQDSCECNPDDARNLRNRGCDDW